MKVLFLEWNSYCNEDMKAAFKQAELEVRVCPFPKGIRTGREETDRILRDILRSGGEDFVFSFNYFPAVSTLCQEFGIPYLSWVYDSPYIHVYSYTVPNACNYIFLFDYAVYEELRSEGITTVYYLPMAVNEQRLAHLENTDAMRGRYRADLSFVGSMYDEPKHRLYDKFQSVNSYTRGYLDAIIQAQKRIYGYNFLKEMLTEEILAEMQKAYPSDPNADTVMTPEAIYADFVLARQVTALERQEVLTLLGRLGEKYRIHLYTNNPSFRIPGIRNLGWVDYDREMPYVFLNSGINLNITLRSIRSGIPLRVFDIMGCGGFLLTNYQQEMLQYFEPDTDFVYYQDHTDLLEKAEYYLTHEKERGEIAANGCRKVREEHTLRKRIGTMLKIMNTPRD